MPPSPLLLARMMKARYFTVTTIISTHTNIDNSPSTESWVTATECGAVSINPVAGFFSWRMHSESAYSGLVPMSPNTMPSAVSASPTSGP
jgi:hypothetical protein